MKISPFQALTLLAKKYKDAVSDSAEALKFAQIKHLFLMGVQNSNDFETITTLLTDKSLEQYDIAMLQPDEFELLREDPEHLNGINRTNYFVALDKLEIINNDPSRRYFESILCHETLRENLDDLDETILEDYFNRVFAEMPISMRLLVPMTIYAGDVNGAAAQRSSTAPEYITAIQKLANSNNFPSFKPPEAQGSSSDEILKQRMNKMLLIVKTAHAAMTAVNRRDNAYYPLNIYGEKNSVYSGERRGRSNRTDEEGAEQTVKSNNLGIMRSYMPLGRDDTLFEETTADTANQYRRPADASTYNAASDMPQKFFSTQVSPFVNSISGTMLCQLRIMAKLLEEQKLEYADNPEQLAQFFKCFVSYMIYNAGGHSLNEFTSVFQLPQVQEIFAKVPGFEQLNLRELFQISNDGSFMSAMDQAIGYNERILARDHLHAELTDGITADESQLNTPSPLETKIREQWDIYHSEKSSDQDKFRAKQFLLSDKDALSYYKKHFCNSDGEIKTPLSYSKTGAVSKYTALPFETLMRNRDDLESVVFARLKSASFIHYDELTDRARAKLSKLRASHQPIQEQRDNALDILLNGKLSEDKEDAASLIIKNINAAKRLAHEAPSTFLNQDSNTIAAVLAEFSRQGGQVIGDISAPISAEIADINESVRTYIEAIRQEKKARYYQVSTESPSFGALLDKAYEVYLDNDAHLMDKELAQEFLIYALDIKKPNELLNAQIISSMRLRDQVKESNPNFIPGRSPFPQDLTTPEVLAAVAKTESFRKTDNPTIQSLFEQRDLLDVISKAKMKDSGGKRGQNKRTIFFNPQERDTFRVDIHQGNFMSMGERVSTNSSTSHGKNGFAAFTLSVDGELSVFPHIDHDKTGIAHSSMNEGKPVVCAGEVKIENGKLLAITTYSGHYRPTLYNIYKALDYFEQRGVDISKTKLHSFENPAEMGISTKPSEYPRFYESYAKDLMQSYKSEIRGQLHSVRQDLENYKSSREGLFHRIFHHSDLTAEKLEITKSLIEYLDIQEQALNKTDSLEDYNSFMNGFVNTIETFSKENIEVSNRHGRSKGKLDDNLNKFNDAFSKYKSSYKELKGKDACDENRKENLKNFGRSQS